MVTFKSVGSPLTNNCSPLINLLFPWVTLNTGYSFLFTIFANDPWVVFAKPGLVVKPATLNLSFAGIRFSYEITLKKLNW